MPGLTAYFGLLEVGKPQAGETLVVSGAAAIAAYALPLRLNILVAIAAAVAMCLMVEKTVGLNKAQP
jgi:NADPH-dependent curcumin reductase CurA